MGVKISGLTAKGTTIADTDLVEVSQSAGGGLYTSRSVTGANIKALVTDANMTTSDITTNDVSTSKHGFAPKAPNDTTKFLRGDGTWAVPASGGLTEFTELETTAAPNATVPVNSLTPVTATTDADAAFVPKGAGALLAAVPNNLTSGGNKRGQYAVDWQMLRNANVQVASGNRSAILGGYNNIASGTYAISFGNTSSATNDYSIAIGQTAVSSGNNSISLGYANTASNTGATALGYSNTANAAASFSAGDSNIASGSRCVAIGQSSTASGDVAVALGRSCTSSGARSFTTGYLNTASGQGSQAMGEECTAAASYAMATGNQANTSTILGRKSHAILSGFQQSNWLLRRNTSGNTLTYLTTDGNDEFTAGATNMFLLVNNQAMRFKGTIIGKQSGSANVASWDINGLVVRTTSAANTTLVVSNVTLVQNTPAWGTPTLTANTTRGGISVSVTGASATNINWTCYLETTEVIYA
jgi:hypothetical protein